MVIKIDFDECTGCFACIDACPSGVLEEGDGVVAIANIDDCIDCGACVDECPSDAISLD